MSGQCCEVKQRRARLVAGWVTQALEQGGLGSCAHAGYHQFYNGVRSGIYLVKWLAAIFRSINEKFNIFPLLENERNLNQREGSGSVVEW